MWFEGRKTHLFHDGRRGWKKVRRQMASRFGVNTLAKVWVRSKRLRALKTWCLRRTVPPPSRLQKITSRPLRDAEIRLLRIKPGYAMNTIECDFWYTDLQYAGEYAALSYTWGQAAPSIPILVNGSVTLISENLYLALLHLRKRGVETLWVDALCINQNDIAERSRQVGQMKDVYQRASIVLVWLGESNELTEHAFDELHGLTELLDWNEAVPSWVFDQEATDQDRKRWRAISEVLYRPWFRRMWVIQEVLSAQRAMMVCGKDMLDLNLFLKLINSMLKARALTRIMSYHPKRHELAGGPMKVAHQQLEFLVKAKFDVTDFAGIATEQKFKSTLLDYLAETRWAEATDPRDKVYGILSLADEARSLGYRSTERRRSKWFPFTADYNLTKAEVFIRTTKAVLHTTRSLAILQFAGYGSNKASGLPSWVPDWASDSPHPVSNYLCIGPSSNKRTEWRSVERYDSIHCNINRHCAPSFALGIANTLTVKGVKFDTITALSRHSRPETGNMFAIDPQSRNDAALLAQMHQSLEAIYQWIENCVQLARKCSPYPTGLNTWTSFWKTLNANDSPDNSLIPEGFEALLNDIRKALSALEALKRQFPLAQTKEVDTLSEIASAVALSNCEDCLSRLPKLNLKLCSQKFATTEKKYMGLVPNTAMVGDLVCVMYGCELPFILRSCGRRRFEFIGHGIFQGFDFDDAVVESSSKFEKKKGEQNEKDFDFTTFGKNGRIIYTKLKATRQFTLV